ncbi:unnamed protein product [Tilletia laevis]|uniref:Mitochondrial carrier protein n=2 Tax=Tilletia TaxID=13289 RepID=A0A177V329_9BASI|nr:hypothetical protein CF336_g7648 [Tilletia laevis]KAE8186021.1 hypothetical protein CF328_g7366 [Tilletia controversa]KAE8247027.1 hypothetical protein A4X03_0g7161 [Tilletia caries]KAE8187496.1 hypothetical protein CF335_g7153 [Tilletia laevis]CAD6892738.1 unnamed protein product [Tilletia caries]
MSAAGVAPRREVSQQEREQVESSSSSGGGGSKTEVSRRDALYGALVRALVVLFARPVRLFRPVKVTSLQLLESLARREGRTLSLTYLWRVLRREKWFFLPHLLGPPLAYQTIVGFSLFSVYTLTESQLTARRQKQQQQRLGPTPDKDEQEKQRATFTPLDIVIYSGAAAGVAQCILSAPLDNVRFILENGIGRSVSSAAAQDRAAATSGTHRRRTARARANGTHAASAGVRFGAGHAGPGGRSGPASASQLQVSWRAVAKAALLPFMPSTTHSRLTEQVKQQGNRLAAASLGQAGGSGAGAGAGLSSAASSQSISETKKELWQQTLRAWRGGLHGSGLIMSLCRDSVGFAAFFAVFELSRRCAYHSSMTIDRFQAWINTSLPLLRFGPLRPTQEVVPTHHHHALTSLGPGSSSSDVVYIESNGTHAHSSSASSYFPESDIRPDISYNATRTISGRVVAVLVLVVGGAIGATLYELVGRPFELMRLVIFTGTREWEKEAERRRASSAARAARKRDADAAGTRGAGGVRYSTLPKTMSIRAASPDRAQHGRSAIRGARLRSLEHDFLLQRPQQAGRASGVGLFLALRSANTMGGSTSRVGALALRTARRPAHPLALSPSTSRERKERQRKVALSRQRADAKLLDAARAMSISKSKRQDSSLPTHTHPSRPHSYSSSSSSSSSAQSPLPPPRPSTTALLLAHAKHTDPAFLRDLSSRGYPAPLALLALCGKAYFVGPFLANVGGPDTYLGALKADERVGRMRRAERAKMMMSGGGGGGNASASAVPPSSVGQGGGGGPSSSSMMGTIRYRGTHAWDGALRWSHVAWQSRWGWALRRMATPYGLGFLAFAWFGGDLNR